MYRHYYFRCDGEEDCMMWVNALSKCIAMHAAKMEQVQSTVQNPPRAFICMLPEF